MSWQEALGLAGGFIAWFLLFMAGLIASVGGAAQLHWPMFIYGVLLLIIAATIAFKVMIQ